MKLIKKIFGGKQERQCEEDLDLSKLPIHIAIIMDGNGRWAKRNRLPRNLGHHEGAQTLKRIVRYCNQIGIKYLTVYAFSTENWKRPIEEIEGLMKILREFLANADRELSKQNIRINILGDTSALSKDIQDDIIRIEKLTSKNNGLSFTIALNYGSRMEIINAIKKLCVDYKKGNIDLEQIDENLFSKYLYTNNIPDPDLLIRTSSEYRISNFLLWQIAYTELYFNDVLWPDFNQKHLNKAICSYQKRYRRFGGV